MRRGQARAHAGWALTIVLAVGACLPAQAQKITTPEEFFGFRMGARIDL
jgi:hypothetical protein